VVCKKLHIYPKTKLNSPIIHKKSKKNQKSYLNPQIQNSEKSNFLNNNNKKKQPRPFFNVECKKKKKNQNQNYFFSPPKNSNFRQNRHNSPNTPPITPILPQKCTSTPRASFPLNISLSKYAYFGPKTAPARRRSWPPFRICRSLRRWCSGAF
jgi:hypothetical protein